MRFDRLRLKNFKCFESTDVRLDRGVTVIHGLNGSGKSSLLEASFFALYGAKALDKTLDEVVTIGADETTVELDFTHDGTSYQIRRRLRVRDGKARTAECVLEGPEATTEGATDVRNRVASLLRMDTEAFVNCAYVRQGEVNKLINATPSDRQDMIDDLLQLGTLEEYRERASDARVGVGRVRDDQAGALSELADQIAAKEEKELHARRNELLTSLEEVEAEIERFEDNRENAIQARDQAQEILDAAEEKRKELASLNETIQQLRERIEETEREREELSEHIAECRSERTAAERRRADLAASLDGLPDTGEAIDRETVADELERLDEDIEQLTEEIREKSVEKQEHDSDREALLEQAEGLAEEAATSRERAEELETELAEARETLAEKRETLADLDERITQQREAFADEPIAFGEATAHRESIAERLGERREERAKLQSRLETEREQLEEARELRDAGKCPECGQPVENSPHVDAIGDHEETIADLEAKLAGLDERITDLESERDRAEELVAREETVADLESERETLATVIEERETAIEEKERHVDELREEAAEAEADAEDRREKADAAEERATACKEAIAEYNREKRELVERREELEALAEVLETLADLDEEIERHRQQRDSMAEMNEERRERIAEKRDRRDDLQEEFDEDRIDTAREEKEHAEAYLEQVTEKLDSLADRKSELEGEIGAVENEIDELETLRERHETLAETVDHLESLHEEAADLEAMYGQLRAELRRQNVQSLERLLNETFDLVYQNDTYSRLELDGEYRLTVYQKDGAELDPDQLSGGERALFNLSLRCAIYRLLAEGIDGTAPMPPLILDEPTVFLDAGHVTQLVELVDSMRERGVEQILVVSHDEELVGAADDLLRVRKDATTNRSTVERGTVEDRLIDA